MTVNIASTRFRRRRAVICACIVFTLWYFLSKINSLGTYKSRYVIKLESDGRFATEFFDRVRSTMKFEEVISNSKDEIKNLEREANKKKSSKEIHLITQSYISTSTNRTWELLHSLYLNLQNPFLTKIHLLQEPQFSFARIQSSLKTQYPDISDKLFDKLFVHSHSGQKRLLASEAFEYASKHLKANIVILSNADIVFDETIGLLLGEKSDLNYITSFFLSRYELPDHLNSSLGTQCSSKFQGSHDSFIFIPPLPQSVIANSNFALGSWGIENRLLYEFEQVGIRGRNPCKSIKSWHIHWSSVKEGWMPTVNDGKSSVAFPDTLEGDLPLDWPWEIRRGGRDVDMIKRPNS